MTQGYVAEVSIDIAAPAARVWAALTEPALVKQYFFDTDLRSDWRVGSPITFSGEWQGQTYEDLGEVLAFEPPRRLSYWHWSAMSGTPNTPEYRHTLVFTLEERDGGTHLALTQDNGASETERDHSAANWAMVLDGLKQLVEGS